MTLLPFIVLLRRKCFDRLFCPCRVIRSPLQRMPTAGQLIGQSLHQQSQVWSVPDARRGAMTRSWRGDLRAWLWTPSRIPDDGIRPGEDQSQLLLDRRALQDACDARM